MTYPLNCQPPFHEAMLSGQSHTKKQRHSMTRGASLWSAECVNRPYLQPSQAGPPLQNDSSHSWTSFTLCCRPQGPCALFLYTLLLTSELTFTQLLKPLRPVFLSLPQNHRRTWVHLHQWLSLAVTSWKPTISDSHSPAPRALSGVTAGECCAWGTV